MAVVAEGEAVKELKIDTNTEMKKYPRFEKGGDYHSQISALLNQFAGATRAPGGG